jgi:hypothetical protein
MVGFGGWSSLWLICAGYEWEYSVEETSRDLWKVDGYVPPMPGSDAEKVWAEDNKPSPFEKAKGGLL